MKRSSEEAKLWHPHRNHSETDLKNCSFYDCLYPPVNTVEETEEFVAAKLQEVQKKFDEVLSRELKEAYSVALAQEIKQQTCYIRRKKFLLAFLRAEGFDTAKAALRIGRFLQMKLNLFGPEMLPRHITQDNLNEDDMKLLLAGVYYFSEVDCGGRLIAFLTLNRMRSLGFLHERYAQNIARVVFYVFMSALEYNDQWDQAKGIVFVRFGLDSTMPLKVFRSLVSQVIKVSARALPILVAAAHAFNNNIIERSCFNFTKMLIPRGILCRVNLHNATSAAGCLSVLSQYGIDISVLPISMFGEFRAEFFQKTLRQLRQRELYFPALATLKKKYNESSTGVDEDDDLGLSFLEELDIYDQFSSPDSASVSNDQTILIEEKEQSLEKKYKENPTNIGEDNVDGIPSVSEKSCIFEQPCLPNSSFVRDDSTIQVGEKKHFPSQLMEILQSRSIPDAIWWSRDGTAFVIEKCKFVSSVLPKQFGGIKFHSFIRRLQRWSFQRLSYQVQGHLTFIEYQHQLFQRNSPELMEGMDVNEGKFPTKLMKVINSNESSNSIWWVSNGEALAIDIDLFSCNFLQSDFGGMQKTSFLRLFEKWGFKQLPAKEEFISDKKNVLIFHHVFFQKTAKLSQISEEKWASANIARVETFPKKLYRIVCSGKFQHAIWWQNGGTAFAIEKEKFSCDVLPKEYKGIKLKSFKRNLQRWGFKFLYNDNSNTTTTVFYHPSFVRNSPELLDNWEDN